jgi:alkanesulfonate monooxygenase SsuD/methylene tetrahydromethanopterin reductase-like flavin-dependent oxidoreductase (luciferase family)
LSCLQRQAPGRLYRETIDQAVWAEGLGFGSAWISEHHFSEDDYASSPLTIAAAIGARTSSMRVGTNIIVAALHDPVRLAEDATALSVMTGGRFELGVGLGYHETEFTAFGRQVRQRPSLLEDSIAVIRRAWSGSAERYEGKRFSSPGLPVTPVPETVPRLLTGAQSEPGIDRAARLGDGVITFVQRALRLVRRRAGTPWPPLRGWPGLRQSVGNRRRRPGAGMGRGR